jgi:NodT family efflux transporter outer membrane factor (OMF) lipoprotein
MARLSVAGVLVLASCACSLAPARSVSTDAPAMPEAFSDSGAAPLQQHWWRSFSDPQLDALMHAALQNNFSLRAVWDRLDQAAALARKAGADLYPTLDASASATRNMRRGDVRSSDSQYAAGLAAAYEVDLWGRVRSSVQAAELDRQATAAQLRTAAVTLSAQVATTWYQLAEQLAQARLLQRQLDINRKVEELIEVRFRHGDAGAVDVLQQRQLVESSRGDLTTTEARIAVLRHQLAVLVGEPAGTDAAPVAADASLVEVPALPATGVPAEQLQQRPDVRQDWLALLAADQRVAVAIADRFPRVSLSAGVTSSSDAARDLFSDWLSNLSANLLLPVIDGGRRRAEVDRTRAVAAEALNNYRQTLTQAYAEVEDALVQERQQQAFLASLDKQLRLSGQAIDQLRDSYRNGAVDYLRVLTALVNNQSLERTEIQARRQLIEFRIGLYRALAGGWTLQRPQPAPGTG